MNRKIEALQEAAAHKAQEAQERVEKALERMIKQNQRINFQAVAQSANVSTAYLYKYPEIKQRIITLRDQQKNQSKPKLAPVASDNSKAVIIYNLREETKRLRGEMVELRRANEALTGKLYQVQSSQDLAERLKTENELLKQQLDSLCRQTEISNDSFAPFDLKDSKVSSLDKKRIERSDVNDKIKSELDSLGIKLNTTLSKTIKSTSGEFVLSAIQALKEAMASGNIERPGGWLNAAIKDGWKPNEKYVKKGEWTSFNEWFNLARKQGLIVASTKGDDDKLYVFTPDGTRLPFEQMLAEYPLEKLRS